MGPEGTWWLTSNGLILTAGHVITLAVYEGDVIEFNVPPNNAAGEPQPANPNDQFPINFPIPATQYCDDGVGNDWAIVQCNPNGTGKTLIKLKMHFLDWLMTNH